VQDFDSQRGRAVGPYANLVEEDCLVRQLRHCIGVSCMDAPSRLAAMTEMKREALARLCAPHHSQSQRNTTTQDL
jgi:hypothetical protein